MKHHKQITLLTFILLCGTLSAQEVISSSGNHHENSSAMISYSLGEPVTFTGSTTNNSLTQGFHQSNLTVAGIEEHLALDVKVYPNPTSDRLIIEFASAHADMLLNLYDGAGRLVENRTVTPNQLRVEFDLTDQAAGNYMLNLNDESKTSNTYQIIKSN